MSRNRVMVELFNGLPVRIFKNPKRALDFPPEQVAEWPRRDATEAIRRQVFARSKGKCEYGCGRTVTWDTGELHEEKPRGKGGEISLSNSVFVCRDCHRNDDRAHGNRRLHFGKQHGSKGDTDVLAKTE
jgi:hypothetical protein